MRETNIFCDNVSLRGRGQRQQYHPQTARKTTAVQGWVMPGPTEQLLNLAIGNDTFIVGGAVRDELLGKHPKDFDYVVTGLDPGPLKAAFKAQGIQVSDLTVADRLVGLRIYPEWGPDDGIEICPPRVEVAFGPEDPRYTGNPHHDWDIVGKGDLPIEEDLRRRDYTLNAIAVNARTGERIDPFNGAEDSQLRILRAVSPEAFRDDPLRIIRGLVRVSKDDLTVEPVTAAMMQQWGKELLHESSERRRDELHKMLEGDHPDKAMALAQEYNVLPYWLNKLPTKQMPSDWTALTRAPKDVAARTAVLSLINHLDAQQHKSLLKDLRYDNKTTETVGRLLAGQRDPLPPLDDVHQQRQWLSRHGRKHWEQILQVREAVTPDDGPQLQVLRDKLRQQMPNPLAVKDLAVDGRDLMEAGVPQSPLMGKILTKTLLPAVLQDPSVNTKEQLVLLAQQALTVG